MARDRHYCKQVRSTLHSSASPVLFSCCNTDGFASAIRLRYVVSHDIVLKYGRRLEDAITLARQRVLVHSVFYFICIHVILVPLCAFILIDSLTAFVVGGCQSCYGFHFKPPRGRRFHLERFSTNAQGTWPCCSFFYIHLCCRYSLLLFQGLESAEIKVASLSLVLIAMT